MISRLKKTLFYNKSCNKTSYNLFNNNNKAY